jgi:hypothetical protein
MYYPLVLGEIYVPRGSRRGIDFKKIRNFSLLNIAIKNRATACSALFFSGFIDTKIIYFPAILVKIYVPKGPSFRAK